MRSLTSTSDEFILLVENKFYSIAVSGLMVEYLIIWCRWEAIDSFVKTERVGGGGIGLYAKSHISLNLMKLCSNWEVNVILRQAK